MNVMRVEGDGNCMFRAVAQSRSVADTGRFLSVRDETRQARVLRTQVAVFIKNNPVVLEFSHEYYPGGRSLVQLAKARANRIMRNKVWGEELELRVLSHLLHRVFCLYNTNGTRFLHTVDSIFRGNRTQTLPPLSLAYSGGLHYDAMRPTSSPTSSSNGAVSNMRVLSSSGNSGHFSVSEANAFRNKQYKIVYIQSLRHLHADPTIINYARKQTLKNVMNLHRNVRPGLLSAMKNRLSSAKNHVNYNALNAGYTANAMEDAHQNVAHELRQTLNETKRHWYTMRRA
jgi:hypothetical protein